MLRTLQRIFANDRLMRAIDPLLGGLNLWTEKNRRDPYPLYAELRARGPISRARLFGGWVVAGHAEAERVLRERSFSTNRDATAMIRFARRAGRGEPDFANFLDHNLLMIDGERHARLRGLVNKAFTPRRIAALQPRIEAQVEEVLGSLAPGQEVDLVQAFAQPVPVLVIAEMLGVPARDRGRFVRWSTDLVELLDPLSGREGFDPPRRGMAELSGYFRELLAERRREPRDDLVSAMLAAEERGDQLVEGELLALCALLLVAGHETTTSLISNAVLTLLRHPDERKRLQDDPELLPSAVEEVLRFESPVQLTDRAVVERCELGGVTLEPGTLVAVLIGSANRDPRRFDAPDRFDVGRRDNRHLAFGLGNHFCLGAPLARLETRIALGALLRRFPDLDGDPEPPAWRASAVLRGPARLPVRL